MHARLAREKEKSDYLMDMLYDSPRYALVQYAIEARRPRGLRRISIDTPPPHVGFELVDKVKRREVFFHGPMADYLFNIVSGWHLDPPTVDEVEEIFEGCAILATHPLTVQ
jgi:hypothetical protein